MEKKKKHSLDTLKRAFTIWQKLGYLPWHRKKEKKEKKNSGDFYKGAFNSIPFLNDDAKRTFVQLLLRPGYMIRDYIKGAHERYLAPLTSLIVFYAFFALVAAVLQPVQRQKSARPRIQMDQIDVDEAQNADFVNQAISAVKIFEKGWVYLHLDQFPEEVDTQHEQSIAALEGTLRSQGIPLFIGKFFLLWFAMSWALKRYKLKMSATAAASAYVLCQFSFFMLFVVLATLGKETSISVMLMLVLLVWDYHQWLGVSYKKSFWLAVSTGLRYVLLFVVVILLCAGSAYLVALARS